MQICYIWTDKFKSFHDYSLNLSNEHEFNYCSRSKELTKVDKKSFPKEFFGEKISSLSVLIGINGSGKTTALELICRCISEHYYFKQKYIMIYKIDGDIYLSTNLETLFNVGFDFIPDKNNDKLTKTKPIFFSNVFDNNYIDFEDSVIDLSSNRRLSNRYNYKKRANSSQRENVSPEDEMGDLEQQICFVNSEESNEILDNIPSKIRYEIYRQSNNFLRRLSSYNKTKYNKSDSIDNNSGFYSYLREIFIHERDLTSIKNNRYRSVSTLIYQHILIGLAYHESYGPHVRDFIFSIQLGRFIPTFNLLHIIADELSITIGSHSFTEIFYGTLVNLESFLVENNLDIDSSIKNGKHSLVLDINLDNVKQHQGLCYIFESMFEVNVDWHGISSGQKAYINMFSSIWNCIKHRDFDNSNENTIICIDEGDLYLHPQWQVEFVEKLIRSLPTLSSTKVQIILTTHSPLLISDIPKQCITILNGCNSEDQSPTDIVSFGGNIYDIYDWSFGLNGIRSGNLSTKYIDSITDILDKDELSKSDVDKLNEALELIDDEIINHHIKVKVGKK
ncbi:AAA family ATPase [Vibrio crassostreae]|uniref:AAA family ATPase n=1 Tax=Vibrio crassostreae TaxID=246167 RepID=UPI001B302D98|nr:AAA family ATPase [Vibrio crassostreae]